MIKMINILMLLMIYMKIMFYMMNDIEELDLSKKKDDFER